MHFNLNRPFFVAGLVVAISITTQSVAQSETAKSNAQLAIPLEQSASRGIVTRDPSSIVKCDDEFWVFYTGRGVPSYRSRDLVNWQRGPAVFNTAPEWISKAVPENRNMSFWAPDIIKVGGRHLLYYSVSSMGKMTSAIGLATTPTLNPDDPAYQWTDEGIVVQTVEGQPGDAYNAIDPALFQDKDESLWMTFGSYWTGLKLVQLDPKTGKRLSSDSKLHSVAYNRSIEAAFLCRRDDYYYLFVNWGSCCQGTNSTYNIRVGRSKTITGPYLDKAGMSLMNSGGSSFLPTANGPLIGPGHASMLTANGKDWFVCKFEGDIGMGGQATLAIMPLRWTEAWPEATVHDVKQNSADNSMTQ
ncbi:MAG TPA: arabinan endo-1,5-alpha-L-arabinosidase [Verrucomicrobiae bacterium]|nr:arabinan endo-1,5-alpha-L-arabinosidase [Verrucomicrobiae bacterium]